MAEIKKVVIEAGGKEFSLSVEEAKALRDILNATAFKSSISEIAIHPDYQQIIGMGTTVIPFILQAMNEKPGQWFWALKSITGEDPVPPENRGDIKAMTQSWIKWGKEHGYIY